MAWSQRQQVVLAIVPKVSSTFSLFGSGWILIEVLTDRSSVPKRKHPYHRLLLGMSVYDILESIWNFVSTWAIPQGTEGVWDASGTTATCTAQGFFLTLSVAVPIYNAFLSLYYVLVINYGIPDAKIAELAEPVMHLVAFGWAFFTAFYSAITGLLNNANLWCWIAPLPAGCLDTRHHGDEGNCARGENAWIYRWVFYFVPLWFCIFFATVCTISVYRKVQTYDRITAKYRHPPDRPLHRFNGGISSVASEGSLSQPPSSSADWRSSFSGHTVRKTARSIHDNDCPGDVDSHIDDPIQGLGQVDEREVEAYGDERETAWWDLRSDWRRWQLKRQIFREDHPRTAEVFQQALWYLGVFYLTHVWSTTNRTIQLIKNGRTYFPIIAVHSFFDPLQGFLNWLVYQRPRYVRIRKACPDVGRWGALKMTLTFTSFGGEEPLRRGLPAASALSVSNPRWWPFSPVSRNPGLSSQEGLAGEFYVPQQRAHISSVSGISDVMDVRRHENLCVVPEKSGELSESELQSEDEHRTKTPSTLNSTNGSESEIDAIQVNVLKRTVTGAGEKTKGDTLSDGSNRKDGQ